jgi:hypothetical protein
MRNTIIGCFCLTLLASCASSTDASRTLARETLAEVAAYEQSVRTLHDSLQKAYDDHFSQTATTIEIAKDTTQDAARNGLAFDAADSVLTSGFQPQQFRAFITVSVTAGSATGDKLDDALNNLKAKKTIDDALTADAEKKIKAVRQNLDRLQRPPKRQDELKAIGNLLSVARETIKEKQP